MALRQLAAAHKAHDIETQLRCEAPAPTPSQHCPHCYTTWVDHTQLLLNREPISPDPRLMARAIRGKTVLITGAGGSIGSELARQIANYNPKALVLFDVSENALYEVGHQLPEVRNLFFVLGSVLDIDLFARTVRQYGVQTIYHAAAYKHVPIVEDNPFTGFRNNTFGTLAAAEVAEHEGVERFVLISTDKAVRPSSLMGASKRLAEMVLQAKASDPKQRTIFTMVRFGNVLDSSGSVVRLFRRQIEKGGPVTVTHPGIIRYFMSIPEASALVIQAGSMAQGGEVFVLDMGKPVKIDDLARRMIQLSGKTVRDSITRPHGDIVIKYVGLRPGEKLYEELLIGDNTLPTEHKRIQRCIEPFLHAAQLDLELQSLSKILAQNDLEGLRRRLPSVVEGYHQGGVDTPYEPSLAALRPTDA